LLSLGRALDATGEGPCTPLSRESPKDAKIRAGNFKMTTNLKAIYENGVLRLEEPLSLPNGAAVDVQVTASDADNGDGSKGSEDQWDALTQLLADCAIDTGIPDLASQHDHYVYGIPKRLNDADRTR
jgi:predicted DNA-binding antitoxin AbrB/MazE fold protein